ncbi:MAG: hypothetical protein ACR2PO_10570 [Methyloligellaceae bacterium]
MFRSLILATASTALAFSIAGAAAAHEIRAEKSPRVPAAFDIVHAKITAQERWLEFHMHVSGKAGQSHPARTGKMAGSKTFAYVWPTSLNSAAAGFASDKGILALTVTSHPDFDDTPLFDENGDGRFDNDGNVWHAHWVVLVKDEACGPGALKVRDIPKGATPKMPPTWPGFPLYLDSPGYGPVLKQANVTVRVPFSNAKALKDVHFDGVTAGLRINVNLHNPLFCVSDVFKVASGDLSLPGRVKPAK